MLVFLKAGVGVLQHTVLGDLLGNFLGLGLGLVLGLVFGLILGLVLDLLLWLGDSLVFDLGLGCWTLHVLP